MKFTRAHNDKHQKDNNKYNIALSTTNDNLHWCDVQKELEFLVQLQY